MGPDRSPDFFALADAIVLGPYMLYQARDVAHPFFRVGLSVIGLGTMVYGIYRLQRARADELEPEPTAAELGAYQPIRRRRRQHSRSPQR